MQSRRFGSCGSRGDDGHGKMAAYALMQLLQLEYRTFNLVLLMHPCSGFDGGHAIG